VKLKACLATAAFALMTTAAQTCRPCLQYLRNSGKKIMISRTNCTAAHRHALQQRIDFEARRNDAKLKALAFMQWKLLAQHRELLRLREDCSDWNLLRAVWRGRKPWVYRNRAELVPALMIAARAQS
jgi:hypothetical protein